MTYQEKENTITTPLSEERERLLAMEDINYTSSSSSDELPHSIELPVVYVRYVSEGALVEARLEPTEVEKVGYFLAGKIRGAVGTVNIGPSITAPHLEYRKEAAKGNKKEWTVISDAHIYPIMLAQGGLRIAIKGR